MCGLVPFRVLGHVYLFDIFLWLVVPAKAYALPSTNIVCIKVTSPKQPQANAVKSHKTAQVTVALGVLYLATTAASTTLFVRLSLVKLGNDFVWEGFNTTGMQAYLIDWFNTQVNYGLDGPLAMNVSDLRHSIESSYNNTVASNTWSPLYGSTMQFEATSVAANIQGLRRMDPCQVPWIATQYCWLDFHRRWSVANTARRETRCAAMTANGAVYFESFLRNVDYAALSVCWGDSLARAFVAELSQSAEGQLWLTSVQVPPSLSVEAEQVFWATYNVTAYTTQWQNYKSIGVVETFSIQNAVGLAYPITMKASNGTFHFGAQTSLKFYWTLASDFWLLSATNGSSLIRSSSSFMFSNVTIEEFVLQNNSQVGPFGGGLAFFRSFVGPFGSIDMHHVICPRSLRTFSQQANDALTTMLVSNVSAQPPLAAADATLYPIPKRWSTNYSKTFGGNPFCAGFYSKRDLTTVMANFFGREVSCNTAFREAFSTTRRTTALSLLGSGTLTSSLTGVDICSNATKPASPCLKALLPVQSWLETYFSPEVATSLYQQALLVQYEIRAINVHVIQFTLANTLNEMLRQNIFDPLDPAFSFFGWYMVLDWAAGIREVVSFQGDNGQLTLMSTTVVPSILPPNPLEAPANLVYYWRLCIQYTSRGIVILAATTLVYIGASRGFVEGANMFELNRVGGIVWLGRPMLFVRSLVSVSFLSTATLTLDIQGTMTHLVTNRPSFFGQVLTVLAAGEISWLVIVLGDMFMVLTKDETSVYTLQSGTLVWVTTAIFSFARPVGPTLQVARSCVVVAVDFQLVCSAGTVEIGESQRLVALILLVVVMMAAVYTIDRFRLRDFSLPRHQPSYLLPACALYLYQKDEWVFDSILHLDRASALLCGIVSIRSCDVIYVLDIKTWRTHVVRTEVETMWGKDALLC